MLSIFHLNHFYLIAWSITNLKILQKLSCDNILCIMQWFSHVHVLILIPRKNNPHDQPMTKVGWVATNRSPNKIFTIVYEIWKGSNTYHRLEKFVSSFLASSCAASFNWPNSLTNTSTKIVTIWSYDMMATSIGSNFPIWILVASVTKVVVGLHGDKGLTASLFKHSSSFVPRSHDL
jgi:hypothetical protein